MEHTNVDINDRACTDVKRRCQMSTNREAEDLSLRSPETGPLSIDEARELRGSGWVGDLDTFRSGDAT